MLLLFLLRLFYDCAFDIEIDFDITDEILIVSQDIGQEGEMIVSDMVKDDECIPFPHESHQVLSQELLHIFNAGVLVAVGIGSGYSILGGLLGGARVVAICASKAHQEFVQKNLTSWLKET